jgi:hypothetical protein
MRQLAEVAFLAVVLATASLAWADVSYELVAYTTDTLVRGTVELDEQVTVSVKGDRLRQEAKGSRTVVTRRGARYQKPGHRVTLEQPDLGRRYEINLDARTYTEETYPAVRQEQEATLAAAEAALKVDLAATPPALAIAVERSGERQQVRGRECERVVLRASREVVLAGTRGGGPVQPAPSRFSMTFDLCLAPDTAATRELRAVEERVAELSGERGVLQERQLRLFGHRRDVLAVFELMHRLVEAEQRRLGGLVLRWERLFVGPARGQAETTLFRHRGEVTRIDDGALDAASFELPAGLTPEARRGSP